jgi:hypothetical protein
MLSGREGKEMKDKKGPVEKTKFELGSCGMLGSCG